MAGNIWTAKDALTSEIKLLMTKNCELELITDVLRAIQHCMAKDGNYFEITLGNLQDEKNCNCEQKFIKSSKNIPF